MNERYTLKLDRYSSHRQITAWLLQHQPHLTPNRPCVIYDIGCAQGFLGQLLPAEDFMIYGLDAEPEAVEAAQAYYRLVKLADIETRSLPVFPQKPEVLVLADVLEHTRQPQICLQHILQTYAASGTRVIISLPNIANIYIRWSLLWGKFEYTEQGLLDRTHLHFFTRASALRLLQVCRVQIDQVTATPIPLPLVNVAFGEGRPLWFLQQINAFLARLFPTLFGYQILLYGHCT